MSNLKYRADIDGLRAVAVISVVLFHAFPSVFPGGFIGVDIFFVISGFLISTILFNQIESGQFSFKDFFARRINRIFPSLTLVSLACFLFGWFVLLPGELRQFGKHMAGGAGFIANLLYWKESGYFDPAAETKPLLHLWSLGIEEQFYILWPVLLVFCYRKKISLLKLTIIAALSSFLWSLWQLESDPVGIFYSPLTRFWELLAGTLLAWWARRNTQDINHQNLLSIVGLALFVLGFLFISKTRAFPGFWAWLPVLGSVSLIAAGPKAIINRTLLSNKLAVGIGLISYPLYLWHWPLLSFAQIIEGEIPSLQTRALLAIISFPLAWLTYLGLEKPLRFKIHSSKKTPALAVSLSVVALIGFLTYKMDGFPKRAQIQSFAEQLKQLEFTHNLGRPETAEIMVLGDSHGAHLAPGLEQEFGNRVADFTSGGCIPFFKIDRYDHRFKPGDCLKSMTKSLEFFLLNPQMKTLVLSSMGPVYLEGTAFKGKDEARVQGLQVVWSDDPSLKDRYQVYELAMRETLKRVTEAGKQIVFVIDVPELGFDPKICFDGRLLKNQTSVLKPCAISRAEVDQRQSRYRELLKRVFADYPAVHVYDTRDVLCDEGLCFGMIDGKMLYRDFDHLSNQGARFLMPTLAPLIQETL